MPLRFLARGIVPVQVEAQFCPDGLPEAATDVVIMAKGDETLDARYPGLSVRTRSSLMSLFRGDFTREQVNQYGHARLIRTPGFGPVSAREAIQWARPPEKVFEPPKGDPQLDDLIEMAKASDDPVEALSSMVRRAWKVMNGYQRNSLDEDTRTAIEATMDPSSRSHRF